MKRILNRIEEHMSENPTFASRKTPVSEAAEFMKRMGFRHLPVLENGKIVGVVSERDLKQAQIFATMHIVLEDVMSTDPYCVQVGTPLSVVAANMAERKIGSAVIVDSDQEIVGIFTTTDAMKVLGTLPLKEGIEKFLGGNYLI